MGSLITLLETARLATELAKLAASGGQVTPQDWARLRSTIDTAEARWQAAVPPTTN